MNARIIRIPLILVSLALIVSLVGCGGGNTATPTVNDKLFVPNYVSSLEGLYHWNHLPITISFNVPSNWQTLHASDPDLCQHAADEWNQPGFKAMVSVVSAGAHADVEVDFVSKKSLVGDSVGITNYTVYTSGEMIKASIQVAIDNGAGITMPDADAQAILAHEIGHALGINGHSLNEDDLMFPTHTYGKYRAATTRDLNTAMTAYPSYFGRAALSERSIPLDLGEKRTGSIE